MLRGLIGWQELLVINDELAPTDNLWKGTLYILWKLTSESLKSPEFLLGFGHICRDLYEDGQLIALQVISLIVAMIINALQLPLNNKPVG